MANFKISALTSATTPLAGTEVLPIVQSSATVKASIANIQAAPVSAGVAYGVQHLDSSKTPTTSTSFTYNTGNISSNVPTLTIYGGTTAKTGSYRILSSDSSVDFAIYSTASLPTMMVFTNQALALGTNSVVNFKLETAGNLVPQTAAKGINFTANTPAAGMTSQLLNWYEEGSYTVTLYDAASGGNASATTVTGRYTRVGNMVTCSFSGLNGISTAGMTAGNTLYISLPFTASSTGIGTGSFACENITFGVLRTNAIPVALNSNSRAIFRAYGSNTSSASLIVSNITSGSANIDYFTLTYRA